MICVVQNFLFMAIVNPNFKYQAWIANQTEICQNLLIAKPIKNYQNKILDGWVRTTNFVFLLVALKEHRV